MEARFKRCLPIAFPLVAELTAMSWLTRKQNNDASASGTGKHLLDVAVLEKRLLFSATPLAPLVDGAAGDTPPDDALQVEFTQPVSFGPSESANQSAQPSEDIARLELVFVDSGVSDYQQLIDDLDAGNSTADLEIYLLDASRDGVEQISEILAGYDDVDAIHVLSHGNDGKIRIGNTVLESGNLAGYAGEFAAWQSSLNPDADLLLYGCELAETNDGRTMLEALAQLTGADVAASTDDTGHESLGGDWDLEFRAGVVDSASILNQSSNSQWVGVLAVPVADLTAGGSHTINEGDSLSLDGSNSSDGDGDTLSFAWDLDNDGIFGETNEPTTETASVDWATLVTFGIDDDGTYTIGLQVDDGNGGVATQTTTVTVVNTAPTLSITGTGSVDENTAYTLNLAATDPGDDTLTAWRVDWGDGTINHYSGASTSVTHTYTVAGLTHNIIVSASDEDGRWFTNDLFLGTENANPVYRYDALSGDFELGIGSDATLDSGFQALIGPDGLLYVSGYKSHNVQRFDPDTGAFIDEFVSSGSGSLNNATGIAFGPDGNLYVASFQNAKILRFDGTTGDFIDHFANQGTYVKKPTAIAFGTDGNLYAAGEDSDNVARFDGTTGVYIDDFITAGLGGLEGAVGFAFGSDGNFYVSSHFTDEVLRYDASGAFIDIFVTSGLGGLDKPVGLTFGPDDYLYVSVWTSDKVLRYDLNGDFVDEYIPLADGVQTPAFITFSPDHQVTVTGTNTTATATGVSQTINYNEDDPTVAIGDIVVTDADADENILAILTLNLPATGDLTTGIYGASTSTYNSGSGVWRVSGTVADVNAALADVAFTPALNNNTDSQITVRIRDSFGTGPADGLIQLNVTAQNDVPVIDLDENDSSGATAADFQTNFIEAGGAVLVVDSADAVLADVDHTNLSSLTVTITNLLDGADETLTADVTGTSIVANYLAGTLTLSGSDTVANYQQVLRTVRYDNVSAAPDATSRTIEFVASDGTGNSNTATATVNITTSNNPPTIDLDGDNSSGALASGFNAVFTEDGGAVPIADPIDATLADLDNVSLTSITVTITNLLDGAAEALSANTSGTSISANYTAGVLTLTGTDTVANYQQVLRTVGYLNTSDTPSTASRQITFVANDGGANSSPATAIVSVSPTNDAPTLDLDADDSSGTTAADIDVTFIEGGGSVLIVDSTDAVLADVDDNNLSSMAVTITNQLDGAFETLNADTSGTGITASYSAGTLTLLGVDTVANYQQVLRTIEYNNTSTTPDPTTRVIQVVANDGGSDSNIASANVSITPTNNTPTLDLDANDSSGASAADFDTTHVEGGGAVLIVDSADAVLADADSSNLSSLTVTITNLLDGALETLSADTSGTGISASYLAGTLTLTGSDSVANYQQVLRTIRYDNTSPAPSPTTRVIQFVANDGVSASNVATSSVTITATNTGPTVTAPTAQSPSEDTLWVINGISVSDPDIGSGIMQFSINVGQGTLAVDVSVAGGVTAAEVSGNGSSSVVVTTTLAQLNNTLASTSGLTYLGTANASGIDTLAINVSDMVATDTATVNLNIMPTNDAPVANNDNYKMDPDSTLTVAAAGLLANDFDIDGDAISVVPSGGPSSGTLTLGADGSFQFTPIASFSGFVTFSYAVTDGSVTSAPASVVIQVSSPVSAADIQSANAAPEVEEVVEESATLEEEESEEEAVEETLLIDAVTSDRDDNASVTFTGRGIIHIGKDEIVSMGVMPQRLADLPQGESEPETIATSSDLNNSGARDRRSESSRSGISILGIGRFDSKLLWDDMTELEDQITGSDDEPYYFAGTFAGFSGALSVGYVMWTVRGGLLATSLLAHLPAWSFVDPLLVLNELDDDDVSDDDSLEEMLDKNDQERENDAPREAVTSTGEKPE